MKSLFDQVSKDCSKSITNTYSTSFSMAVKMLSPSIQGAIHAIYGFVRLADEIVDTFHEYNKEALLNELEVELNLAIERKISLNPVLNSFQWVVNKYQIPYDLINAFMASMRADLTKQEYETQEEYNQYIYGSADVVGLMCLRVFVNGDEAKYAELKDSAMRLGSAFQKVNFLRDLKDDTENLERSYFPQLSNNAFNKELKKGIVEEISKDFEAAYVGIKKLPVEAKFGVYTAYIYYKKLLKKLENTEAEKLKETRIRINNPTKFALLFQSYVNYKLNTI